MGSTSKIEWTEASWTPIRAWNVATGKTGWHCEHVSPGCEHCYSESINRRLGSGLAFKPGHFKDVDVYLDEKMLAAPLKWRKPRKIFVCSMTDLFGEWVPDEWIDQVFAIMALTPQHTYQILTKRPERMREYCGNIQKNGRWLEMEDRALKLGYDPRGQDDTGFAWVSNKQFLPNVWLGVSVEDQARAGERIPLLLETPAAVSFISAEPLLSSVDLREWLPGLSWCIIGGESGPGKRPVNLEWLRSIREQCKAAGVPLFVKQIDKVIPIPDDLMIREWPKESRV